ncbi:MAG: BTAD domain-containing putative transcriptional regulator [Candidatus Nanopelagicales bacterium]
MENTTTGTIPRQGGQSTLPESLRVATMQSPTASLRVLGGFTLTVLGVSVELAPIAQRLMALLALRGRTQRSRAAGTLWPETDEVKAMACLRTCMWRVNRLTNGLIISAGSSVQLSPNVEVDVYQYIDDATSSMRSTTRTPATDLREIGYGGELLPGWDEQWLVTDRERLRQLRLHLLEEEAKRQAREGHFGLALEAAFAALSVDPLRETAHRRIIEIHLAEGNVAEARRAYQTCRHVMIDEVGVVPSDATARLMRSVLLSGGAPPRPSASNRRSRER